MKFINTLWRPPIFFYYNFKLGTFSFVQAILSTAIGNGDFEIFVWLKNKSIHFCEMWIVHFTFKNNLRWQIKNLAKSPGKKIRVKLRVKLKKNLKGKTGTGREKNRKSDSKRRTYHFFLERITSFKYLNIFRQIFQNLQLLIKIFSLEE